ncbi:hypothetical protein C5167_021145 [Papaver somniferum]|uniref:PGG domain-containing protein n=1 Tax=Papaver somniferum TaxID=3469 RepID=A0A4Y7IY49_PAPSO|nr:hypothetical protein C5167_021145 [Papaver somniferum]
MKLLYVHISAMCGHVEFAATILMLKPELASEVDSEGFSPLHLASLRKNVDMVRVLLAESRLDPQESVCVNARVAHGNTILHLAVARRQMKMIEYLVNNSLGIDINALNKNGFTAVDILANQIIKKTKDIEIEELLRHVGGLSAREQSSTSGDSQTVEIITPQPFYCRMNDASNNDNAKSSEEQYNDWMTDRQNILMVVAVLMATMAFQAGTNPPCQVVFGKMTQSLNLIPTQVSSTIMH